MKKVLLYKTYFLMIFLFNINIVLGGYICDDTNNNFELIEEKMKNKFKIGLDINSIIINLKEMGIHQIMFGSMPLLDKESGRAIPDSKTGFKLDEGYNISALLQCHIDNGNLDIYNIDMHISKFGHMDKLNMQHFFDDENFSLRKIDIDEKLFYKRDSFEKALISMYKNNFKDGYSFQEYLESNKIDIESRGLEKNGDHSFTIIFLPSRKNIKNLSLLEYMWQATPNNQITIIYDKNGVVKKIGKYKFKD